MDKDNAVSIFEMAKLYRENGKVRKSISLYNEALKKSPDDPKILVNLGNAYLGDGRYQDAMIILRQAIKIKPEDALAHFNLGIVYEELGRADRALAEYMEVVKLVPDAKLAEDAKIRIGSLSLEPPATEKRLPTNDFH